MSAYFAQLQRTAIRPLRLGAEITHKHLKSLVPGERFELPTNGLQIRFGK